MESKKSQVPAEAVEAYNQYIHGEIDRRDFMERLTAVAGAFGVTALVQALMPNYAAAQQVLADRSAPEDRDGDDPVAEGQRQHQGLPGAAGQRGHEQAAGHPRRPREPRPQPAHRGHRAAARARQLHGVRAGRPDFRGRLSGRRREGRRSCSAQSIARRWPRTSYAAAMWLKNRPDSTGKLGVTGFCFGGGIANTLAVRMGADLAAAVPFYGARARRRRTCRRSRPPSSCTMARWTRGSSRRGRRMTRR